jgi:hypothetical protein
MDCLSYRRLKLAAPQDAGPEPSAHMQACADCAAFTRQLEAFEQDLYRSINIAVPEGLAEQIILRHRKPRWFDRRYLAIAATLVLSVSAFLGYRMLDERRDLAGEFIAHVAAEPQHLSETGFVAPARLSAAFAEYGARMDGEIGEPRFMADCVFNGKVAKHILVQTEHGPATLLLLADRRASMSTPLSRDGFSVVIVPLANGSMGIVTETADQASRVESLVKSRLSVRG